MEFGKLGKPGNKLQKREVSPLGYVIEEESIGFSDGLAGRVFEKYLKQQLPSTFEYLG